MSKKALIMYDNQVKTKVAENSFSFLSDYGYEVQYLQDYVGATDPEMNRTILGVEQQGLESFSANPDVIEAVRDAEIMVVHMTLVNKEVLDAAKKLKVLGICRGGYETVNVDYAKQKGIQIVNAAGRNAEAVADATICLMIGESRNIIRSSIEMRKGNWKAVFANDAGTHIMRNMKVGLIGLGHIGKMVKERLVPFGSSIMAYDPFLTTEQISAEGVLPVSLDELLEEADIVSMHLRLSDKTQKFFDREKFCKMKPTAFFINTARAGLVDEKALYDTLKNRRIAGAAIDVFTQEPLPVESPLLELENLTVTPHLAGYSCDTPRISTELIARELKNYCCGKPFIHSV